MKKLLVLATLGFAAVFLNKKWQESKVVKTTWSKATDSVN
ncbi:DLW-39 family protein [Arthrobacter antibioticus]|nr:DLW-39 family protein [Arthrobacter sp. H35-MC1]MDJ0316565.1 DLW-39 family protein [Arthrobacter sp. H35-MC1]